MTHIDLGNKSAQELAGFVDRIESLSAELFETRERIKSEYAEAAGAGFDKRALRQIVKERTADKEKTAQHRATTEVYRRALGGLAGTPLGDWARGWMAEDERLKQRSKESSAVFDDFLARAKAAKEGPSNSTGA